MFALTSTTGLFRRVGHLARTVLSALGLLVDALPVLGKRVRKTQPDTLGGHLLQALGHKIEHIHLVWTWRTCSCWPMSPPPAVFADSALGSEHSCTAHKSMPVLPSSPSSLAPPPGRLPCPPGPPRQSSSGVAISTFVINVAVTLDGISPPVCEPFQG